ncbi:MAG: hypothetical protein KatS3mg114_0369 [Planctomycetaceae bacterium]|nr:MAG: hypothetical protein KatS3mg114_0369 [Planctomycetaceae bacterium]
MTPKMTPWRVCSFESRRADEMHSLMIRQGWQATVVPSLVEEPLLDPVELQRFLMALADAACDIVVFLTGVGAQRLFEAAVNIVSRDQLRSWLEPCRIVVRGPKPYAVLRQWQIHVDEKAPEPHTWRDVLAVLQSIPLTGKRVFIQEYGAPQQQLAEELRKLGAIVKSVMVYRWQLPAHTEPLEQAIRQILAQQYDALLFTSAQQVRHLAIIAERMNCLSELILASQSCLLASIGPIASEAVQDVFGRVDIQAEHGKMGSLVKTVAAALESRHPTSPSTHPSNCSHGV